MRRIGWATAHTLQSHSLARWFAAFSACPWRAVSHHYFCIDRLCELQISLVGELKLTKFGHNIDIWWDVREIYIQLKPLKLIPLMETWLYKVVHQEIAFKRRLYSSHLRCKHMIYVLTLFWNNFVNLTFFLVIAPAGISPRGEIPRRHPSNSRVY